MITCCNTCTKHRLQYLYTCTLGLRNTCTEHRLQYLYTCILGIRNTCTEHRLRNTSSVQSQKQKVIQSQTTHIHERLKF